MRMVVIGDAQLFHGNCMELLPVLGGVDHCITDPPYEAEAHTKGRRLLGKQQNGQRTVEYGALDFDSITEKERAEVSRLCAELCQGWFLAFCQAEAVSAWRHAHEAAGAKYRRSMVWIKPDGAPQFTGDRPGMGYESIVASWCGEGRSVWNGGGKHGVFTHPNREDNNPKQHTTQKPIGLMMELVSLFSNSGDVVLDPFMGSGTTGVACAKMGRRFIGIERDERYFEIACSRIAAAYAQPDLFVNPPAAAVQENLNL